MSRSKERIIRAAFALFEEKSFNKITITEILDRAYVSRGTFYKYFSDKYELLNLYYGHAINTTILCDYNGHNWDELQARCYQFGYEHKPFFKNLKGSTAEEDFWIFMHRFSYNIFRTIRLYNRNKTELDAEEVLTIDAYVNTAIFLFKKLVLQDCKLSPREVSDIAYRSLQDDYKIIADLGEEPSAILVSEMDHLW